MAPRLPCVSAYLTDEFSLCYLFTMPMNKARKLILLAAAVAALAAAATAAAGTTLSLVAYSTPKVVLGKIIQAWQQTPNGKDVSFNQSYGALTDQARAGSPARG